MLLSVCPTLDEDLLEAVNLLTVGEYFDHI